MKTGNVVVCKTYARIACTVSCGIVPVGINPVGTVTGLNVAWLPDQALHFIHAFPLQALRVSNDSVGSLTAGRGLVSVTTTDLCYLL